mmetsp:Transcript_1088/g.887  ORF Transcript_1088/g.887 Transcript_1088/m.887 type:complete len:189 (+) Transcript_1088:179-745(+)
MYNVFIPIAVIFYVWVYEHTIGTYLFTLAMCFVFHTIEMISVLLTFAFNKEYYEKCCKICDNGCNKFLMNIAEKKLNDKQRQKMRVNSTTTSTTPSKRISITPNTLNTKSPATAHSHTHNAIAIGSLDTLHRVQTHESTAIGSLDTMNFSKFSNPTDDDVHIEQAPTLTRPPTHLSINTISTDIYQMK